MIPRKPSKDPLVSDDTQQLPQTDRDWQRTSKTHERWPKTHWPRQIGEGNVIRKLGEGGAAIVFETRIAATGEHRTVKALFPDASPSQRRRFEREIAIVSQLDHPNVAGAIGHGWWNNLPYLEMRKPCDQTLAALIRKRRALPPPVAVAAGLQLAHALGYCHHATINLNGKSFRGLIHRDIKPSNILVEQNGELVVTDFSIATPVSHEAPSHNESAYGSIPYFAPEILYESPVDFRCDIFSFGCTLYELIYGMRAFDADTIETLMARRKNHDYLPLDPKDLRIPRELAELVNQCMAFEAAKRPGSLEEITARLEAIYCRLARSEPKQTLAAFMHADTNHEHARISVPWSWIGIGAAASVALVALIIIGGRIDAFSRLDSARSRAVDAHNGKPSVPTDTGKAQRQPRRLPPVAPRQSPYRRQLKQPAISLDPDAHPRRGLSGSLTGRAPGASSAPSASASADSAAHEFAGLPGENPATDSGYAAPVAALIRQHQSRDLLHILKEEAARKRYDNVLAVLAELPPHHAQSPIAQVYRFRALQALGILSMSHFTEAAFSDAELLLIRARLLYHKQRYDEALGALDSAAVSPAALIDRAALEKEIELLKARCHVAKANENPDAAMRQKALESWKKVKQSYRHEPHSPALAEANRVIRTLNERRQGVAASNAP